MARAKSGSRQPTEAVLAATPRQHEVLRIIRESCPSRVQYVTPLPPVMEPGEVHIPTPIEKHVGGATIFILNVEHFEHV